MANHDPWVCSRCGHELEFTGSFQEGTAKEVSHICVPPALGIPMQQISEGDLNKLVEASKKLTVEKITIKCHRVLTPPKGATHWVLPYEIMQEPSYFKCTIIGAAGEHWWYWRGETKKWIFYGHGRPDNITEIPTEYDLGEIHNVSE